MRLGSPLTGKRVLVTRARHQAGQLSYELERLGAEAIEIPAIEVVFPLSFGPLDNALRNLRRYKWLIVTSVNAVRAIQDRRAVLQFSTAEFANVKIAAVGSSTARALTEAGLTVAVTPKEYVAEALARALPEQMTGERVLIARAAIARDVVPDALAERGAKVDVVEAYRTVVPQESVEKLRELFAAGGLDAATFTSSSTVANFFRLMREAGFERQPDGLRAISIGPITSHTLREHGWEPAAEADPHDVAGLLAAAVRGLGAS